MALAVSLTHFVPTQAVSRKWFRKRGGLVGGISATASSAGTAIFMPLMTMWAVSQGWRFTSVVSGIGFGATIALLALFVIRDTPESMGLHPDGEKSPLSSENSAAKEVSWTVKEATKTRQFWLLFVARSLLSIPVQGVWASLVIWAVDLGSPAAGAGLFVTAHAVPSGLSMIAGGWLGDRYGKKRVLSICQVLGALIMLYAWLGVHSQRDLFIFSILFGFVFAYTGLFAPYLGDLFGRASVGSLFGISTVGLGLIGGCAPIIWAKTFEIFGSYNVACLISAICFAVAAVAIFLIQPPGVRTRGSES